MNTYRAREGDARFTDSLNALNGLEGRTLKGGKLRWGWRGPMKPEPFFQVMYTRPSRGHRLMFSPSSHWEKP